MRETVLTALLFVTLTGGPAAAQLAPFEPLGKVALPDAAPLRFGDVAAFRDHAFVAAGASPACERGGVHVVDIHDPAHPVAVAFAAAPGASVTEGVEVLDLATPRFTGQVLLYAMEGCRPGAGGLALVDVTDPRAPQPLATDLGGDRHSLAAWTAGDRAYAAVVDNGAERDVDILEITDPHAPAKVAETGLVDFPQAPQRPRTFGAFPGAFAHDLSVQQAGGRTLLLVSYWDAGHVLLDVTDPARPRYLTDTDYAAAEPFADRLGLPPGTMPEGNAHQAVRTPDGRYLLGVDEDLAPHRDRFEITSGQHTGATFAAVQPPGVRKVDATVQGPTAFLGQACGGLPPAPAGAIALVESGGCASQEKLDQVKAAGYPAALMFVAQDACAAQPDVAVTGDIPFAVVGRSTGLRLLDVAFIEACAAQTPAPGSPSADVLLERRFDGWGYLHMYDAVTMADLDQHAIPEALDPARAAEPLSVHEVAATATHAYVTANTGGLRVLTYGPEGLSEVAGYVDREGGSAFWGLTVHAVGGEEVVLATDRGSGLWVFKAAD